MDCRNSQCPIRGKGPGWICTCEPPDRVDEATHEITDQVAEDMKKSRKK